MIAVAKGLVLIAAPIMLKSFKLYAKYKRNQFLYKNIKNISPKNNDNIAGLDLLVSTSQTPYKPKNTSLSEIMKRKKLQANRQCAKL